MIAALYRVLAFYGTAIFTAALIDPGTQILQSTIGGFLIALGASGGWDTES